MSTSCRIEGEVDQTLESTARSHILEKMIRTLDNYKSF
jgi:hypothetical protein